MKLITANWMYPKTFNEDFERITELSIAQFKIKAETVTLEKGFQVYKTDTHMLKVIDNNYNLYEL